MNTESRKSGMFVTEDREENLPGMEVRTNEDVKTGVDRTLHRCSEVL